MNWIKNLLVLILGIFSALLIGEIFLRYFYKGNYYNPNRFMFDYSPRFGATHLSYQKAQWTSNCYEIKNITTNKWGMVHSDKDFTKEKSDKYRIAVLGDSFFEALQVNDGQDFVSLLSKIFQNNIEILNFSTSGYGTFQEYLTYIHKVRQFKPDLVILGFFIGNDIRDNSLNLSKYLGHTEIMKPFLIKKNSKWIVKYPKLKIKKRNNILKLIHRKLLKHSSLYSFFWYNLNKLIQKEGTNIAVSIWPKNKKYLDYGLYCMQNKKLWKQAWETTKKSLLLLKEATKKDNVKFATIILVDPLQLEENPKLKIQRLIGKSIPYNFNIKYPTLRLKNFLHKNNILTLNLLPYFLQYKKKFNLKHPFFSYKYDGHWNPLGHFICASQTALFLIKNNLIHYNNIQKIKNNLNKSPLQILGIKGFKQIYKTGRYIK